MENTPPLLRYDEVTAAWLTQALQHAFPGVSVRDVERGPIFGFKQNKFRVRASYAGDSRGAPRDLIVKGNFPGEKDPSTGSAWAMATELRSLRDLVPMVAAPYGPRWFHIGVGEEASEIVMEDLAPHGAQFFDAHTPLDLGQAMAFMGAFARLHASSWNSPAFAPGREMGPGTFAGENRRLVNEVYFPTFFEPESWRAYVDLPRGRALPKAMQDLSAMRRAWERLWRLLANSALVVIHGDEHLGNLFVTAKGEPGVIDWVARPEHWPIGVAYFLCCALDAADRRRWERSLIAHYLQELAEAGVAHPPAFEEAWLLYRCATLYPVVTWLNNSGVWQPEAINTANAVRAAVAALDHDALALLG